MAPKSNGQTWRFVVIGDVGGPSTYHVGDEAMLDANLTLLRERFEGCEITVLSADPEWSARHFGCRAIAPIGFPPRDQASDHEELLTHVLHPSRVHPRALKVIDAIACSDGLLISGGGNLCSTWPEHLFERIALIRLAKGLSKPIVVVGQSIGPVLSPLESQILGAALASCDLVGVREYHAFAAAVRLGVPLERLLLSQDDAAFLEPEPPMLSGTGIDPARPYVAVTFAPFHDFGLGEPIALVLARELRTISRATQAQVLFIPHHPSDVPVARRISDELRSLSGRDDSIVLPVLDAREVVSLTARAALVVSSRYHPVVFALAHGVPALGVFVDSYTRVKIRGGLAHASLERFCLSLGDAVAGRLASMAEVLWQERTSMVHRLRALRMEWQQSRIDRAALIERVFRGGPVKIAGSSDRLLRVLDLLAGDFAWLAPMSHAPDLEARLVDVQRHAIGLAAVVRDRDEEIEKLKHALAGARDGKV